MQGSLHAASTRLEQLDAVLVQLSQVSREKAELERTKGTSCPNSKPGDGPRRKMRDEDANRFSFASEFVKGRVGVVRGEITALDADLAKIAADDPSLIDPKTGTRNEFMKALSRKLDMTVTGFNAFRTDPQLKELRSELAARADKSTFGDPKNGGFLCPDVQLSQALHGAVRAIDQIPELEKPVIAAVEGSEATIEAFRRLTTTFYGLLAFKLPPSADELRELQKKAIQSVESGAHADLATEGGLSKRDYVPLAIALFVDLCLFLVSMGRPAGGRLNGLIPKMREAERGPVIEILSRFNDIHRDRQIRENFELFRHVVFDVHGAYFVAVPLDAPPRLNPREREELRLEAQLLANFFTSFEKDQIFKRTWTPFPSAIRRKLRQQGSKFAESEAFRVYRFRDGAWAEIILGAVMGAARRAEAEAARRRIEEGLARTSEPAFAPGEYAPLPFPSTEPRTRREDARRGPTRGRDDQETGPHSVSTEPRRPPPEAGVEVQAKFRTGFGAYARGAQTELLSRQVREPDVGEPANSNTGPAAATTRPSVAARKPAAESGAPPAQATRAAETVDVVLKRETATVSLPAASAASDGLIGRLGQALETIDATEAEPLNSGATVTLVATPAPLEIAGPSDAGGPTAEGGGPDLDTDPSTADAVDIAGRLRPAIARG